MNIEILCKGTVERFDGNAAWFYLEIPSNDLPAHLPTGHWGFVKIVARVGRTSWNTSLMPKGDGEYFVALKKEIRKREKIFLGDEIKMNITIKG